MNKEEILAKSRSENNNGDERDKKIQIHSSAISAAIGGVLCMLIVIAEELVFDRKAYDVWLIYVGMMFSGSLVKAVRLKKKGDIWLSVIWGVCFLLYLAFYVMEAFGW